MSKNPIIRCAQGVRVTRWRGGYPASTVIEVGYDDENAGVQIKLFGREQARGLLWALQDVINSDPDTD